MIAKYYKTREGLLVKWMPSHTIFCSDSNLSFSKNLFRGNSFGEDGDYLPAEAHEFENLFNERRSEMNELMSNAFHREDLTN